MRFGLPLLSVTAFLAAACGNGSDNTALSKTTLSVELTPRPNEFWPPVIPCAVDNGAAGAATDASGADTESGFCPDYSVPVSVECSRSGDESDAHPFVGVTASITNYYLRAPDACPNAEQCGFLSVTLDAADDGSSAPVSAVAAGPNLVLDLTPFAAAGTLSEPHVLRAELLKADGKLYTGPYAAAPVVIDGVSFVCRDASE